MNLAAKRWLGGLRLRKESLFLLWGILLKDSSLPMRCFYWIFALLYQSGFCWNFIICVDQDKLSKLKTRTKSGPTSDHPHWSFHPFGTIQQRILHRFRTQIVKEEAVSREIAYILFCPQIQTETRPQKSSKLLRVLPFSGRHFSCSIQTSKMILTESLKSPWNVKIWHTHLAPKSNFLQLSIYFMYKGRGSEAPMAIEEGVKVGEQRPLATIHHKLQPLSSEVKRPTVILNWSSRYSMVLHLDSLSRDLAFLSQKLNLDIDPGFVRRQGGGGRTSQSRWWLNLNNTIIPFSVVNNW